MTDYFGVTHITEYRLFESRKPFAAAGRTSIGCELADLDRIEEFTRDATSGTRDVS